MEWHLGALRGVKNTLLLILGRGCVVVKFVVIHPTLYTWHIYSFVPTRFLIKKKLVKKSRTYIA